DRLDRPLDAARARATIGDALWNADRLEAALERLQSAYETLASTSTPEVAALAAQYGRIRYFAASDETGVREALPPIERAMEIAEAGSLGSVLSDAMNTKSLILDSLHRPEESYALLEHSLSIALDHDAMPAAMRAYNNLSNFMWGRDRYADARSYEEAGRELADRTGYRNQWWFLTGHVGNILYLTGEWDELEQLWQEVDRQREDPAAEFAVIPIDYVWALVQGVGRGDVDAFLRLVESMRKLIHSEEFQGRTFGEILMANTALLTGTPEDAIPHVERVLNSRDLLGGSHWLFKTGLELGIQAAFAVNKLDRAESIIAGAAAIPPGERSPLLDATVAGYGARVAARRGADDAEIEAGFREAERIFMEIGDPFHRAQNLLAHAEWLATTERSGEALVVAGDAAEIFRTLRATPWIERAERLAPAVVVS
ncbi:MAG TPA: hypothetical protein VGJ67_07010, partial [Actinomycetota bacterium]